MPLTTAAHEIMTASDTRSFPPEYWELIERYRGELLNQAHAILGSVEDAEDVVQETLCEVFRDSAKLKQARSIGAWLRQINRFNALTRLKKRKRDSRREPASTRASTTGGLSAIEIQESLSKAIEALPENMRVVVVLRYWEHLSYKEISARLRMPVNSVGRLLYDASLRLFDKLNVKFQLEASPDETTAE